MFQEMLTLPGFDSEMFLHVLHGKQYDKQVQGGSVLNYELPNYESLSYNPAPCVSPNKPKALCEVLKEK